MNVLIVEDEKSLAREIAEYLRKESFICDLAFTGMDASEKIAVNLYDFVLLDLGLPDYDGIELLKEAQALNSEASFIIITARGAVEDKVKGLNLGADDYLAKPFALIELYSRMQAVARRKFAFSNPLITIGDYIIDTSSRIISCNGKSVDLTKKEYDLLLYFVMNRNKVLTRQQLYEHIWGNILEDQYDSNFIDVHVKNLRKKLSLAGAPTWLETVRGIGYRATTEN